MEKKRHFNRGYIQVLKQATRRVERNKKKNKQI